MVEIVENWAEVIGIVVGLMPAPGREGFVEMKVQVEEVRAVAEFPNLLHVEPGENITVLARSGQIDDAGSGTGSPVDLRLRVAGPPITYFADAEWRLERGLN